MTFYRFGFTVLGALVGFVSGFPVIGALVGFIIGVFFSDRRG